MRGNSRLLALEMFLAVGVPAGLAAAWIPLRATLPNVDLALILVVVACCAGALGQRAVVAVTAVSSALFFELFDTAPFERLAIARNPDLETTLVVAVVSVIVGETALRVRRQRLSARERSDSLSVLQSVAALVASGEELVAVIENVVSELTKLLGLASCFFEGDEPEDARPHVSSDGQLVLQGTVKTGEEGSLTADLPVFAQGVRIGQFVLEMDVSKLPEADRLAVAVTLASAVGGAFLAQAPPPLPPDRQPSLSLRLVRRQSDTGRTAEAGQGGGPRAQEASGSFEASAAISA